MSIVNIHQAKTNLSKLVDAVMHGEEVIIAKSGKPMIKMVRLDERTTHRKPGLLKGRITLSPDFNAPLPDDLLNQFEGK